MLAVTGFRTTIVRELQGLVSHERVTRIERDFPFEQVDRYVLAAGILHSKPLCEQSPQERDQSLTVNFIEPLCHCEDALQRNPNARVVLIGSESAYLGSYDELYAVTKLALHRYVVLRKVLPNQTLGLISPPIIADSGMTQRRHDYPDVLRERRHVFARDVARAAYRILYETKPGQNFIERM